MTFVQKTPLSLSCVLDGKFFGSGNGRVRFLDPYNFMKTNSGRLIFTSRGFTLIELLVVVAIIAILSMLGFGAARKMAEQGRQTKELHAATQLITAYIAYAGDHDGELLRGYDKSVQDVSLSGGRTVSGEMCCRYPWRLAPYLAEQVEEIFLLNDNKKATKGKTTDSFEYQYRVSLHPALGLNAYCLGGYDDGTQSGYFQKDVVTRLAQVSKPGDLIVFASARMKQSATDNEEVAGNYLIKPPKLWRTKWDKTFDSNSPSSSFGNVDLRWQDQAVCAFLDGSVRKLGATELRDMRHWSNTAAQNNDPDYTVPR